jgi:hypothetical protein
MTAAADELRRAVLAAFRMPATQTMVSRKSSITNAFVSAIIPVVPPNHDDVEQSLKILGMDSGDVQCAYCGDPSTEWDHLRPLVLNRRPTGFISEIANLVPACGKCNQSKGNKEWRVWMLGNARHSPTGRKLLDVKQRISRLESYEKWRSPTRVDFESIVGPEEWAAYWNLCEEINAELRECQQVAETIKRQVLQALHKSPAVP